jgi:hypothetical protein
MANALAFAALSDPTRREVFEQIDPQGLGQVRAWFDQFWDVALTAFAAEAERQENEGDDCK